MEKSGKQFFRSMEAFAAGCKSIFTWHRYRVWYLLVGIPFMAAIDKTKLEFFIERSPMANCCRHQQAAIRYRWRCLFNLILNLISMFRYKSTSCSTARRLLAVSSFRGEKAVTISSIARKLRSWEWIICRFIFGIHKHAGWWRLVRLEITFEHSQRVFIQFQ